MLMKEGETRIPAGCSISGFINRSGRRTNGSVIVNSIACMHDRSNGLGGGYAGYGIYPEYKDQYAFHVFYDSNEARIKTEAFIDRHFDVINLSRLDEGEEFPREDTDMYALAKEVAANVADEAERRGVSLTVTGGQGTVNGVRRLLWEIVWNLAENAVKYSKPEGGHANIDVSRLENGHVRVTVSDDGLGIPREAQERVFERFYRVDKSHSKASGGTGLGLSIVKHAVQYHHGVIELKSEPGRGTSISVTF